MDDLLRNAFNDEGLRRMTRKAGVSSVREKDLSVNDEIRMVAEGILRNICQTLEIYAEYHKASTVNENILRQTFKALDIRMDYYAEPGEGGFPACESLRSRNQRRERKRRARTPEAKAKAKAKAAAPISRGARGSKAHDEIKHEQTNIDCVYLEQLPFTKLLRELMDQYATTPLRFQTRVVGWIQFVVESLLIKILRHTGVLVREISKGHADSPDTKPTREAINARDIAVEVDALREYWPVLRGRRRQMGPRMDRGAGGGADDSSPPAKTRASPREHAGTLRASSRGSGKSPRRGPGKSPRRGRGLSAKTKAKPPAKTKT
jgi:hypothetical protein